MGGLKEKKENEWRGMEEVQKENRRQREKRHG